MPLTIFKEAFNDNELEQIRAAAYAHNFIISNDWLYNVGYGTWWSKILTRWELPELAERARTVLGDIENTAYGRQINLDAMMNNSLEDWNRTADQDHAESENTDDSKPRNGS